MSLRLNAAEDQDAHPLSRWSHNHYTATHDPFLLPPKGILISVDSVNSTMDFAKELVPLANPQGDSSGREELWTFAGQYRYHKNLMANISFFR